jgi:hypothetical protein
MWHKAWAQSGQGVPDRHITSLASWPWIGAFPKTILSTCPKEVVLNVSNAQWWCKEETWLPGQVAWPTGLTSEPHTPNVCPEYRLTPPINTTMLLVAESLKKVRFSPPPRKGLPNSIFVE